MTSRLIVLAALGALGTMAALPAAAQEAPASEAVPEAAVEAAEPAPSATAEPALPDGIDPARDRALLDELHREMHAGAVLNTLTARNARTGKVPQEEIDALDAQWRAERKSDDQPLITAVLASPLSGYLLHIQAGSLGLYSEIFVMDRNGLNAGQSAITSDYWQADEAKFQKTHDAGPDAVFIDDMEFHEDSNTWRQQVNMTISDAGKAIGAVTVEFNLTELARRRAAGII